MRKIVLASAITVSALGLAACSENTENAAGEAVEGAAADTEANLDAVGNEMGQAADDAGQAIEGATADAENEMNQMEGDMQDETTQDAAAD